MGKADMAEEQTDVLSDNFACDLLAPNQNAVIASIAVPRLLLQPPFVYFELCYNRSSNLSAFAMALVDASFTRSLLEEEDEDFDGLWETKKDIFMADDCICILILIL